MADSALGVNGRLTPGTSGPRARWADLYDWQLVERGSGATPFVVQQATMQVRSAILAGVLRPAAKVPSSRDLAARLGVARASVVAAYEQLLAE